MRRVRKTVLCAFVVVAFMLAEGASGAARPNYTIKKIERSNKGASFTITYPEFSLENKEVEHKINSFIEKIILRAPTFFEEPAAKSVDKMIRRYLEANSDRGSYYQDIEITVESQVGSIICIGAGLSFFGGGAHDNGFFRYLNFDLRTGERIRLSDLFEEEYGEPLTLLGEERFREEKQVPQNSSLNDYGYSFDNDQFYLMNNFSITERGLRFYYNPYEVAPYVEGPIQILVRYEDIKHLLNKPFRKLANTPPK